MIIFLYLKNILGDIHIKFQQDSELEYFLCFPFLHKVVVVQMQNQ